MLNTIINIDFHIHSKESSYKEDPGFADNSSISIDGGLFGVAWLTAALIGKVFAGGVTVGAAGASAYFGTK